LPDVALSVAFGNFRRPDREQEKVKRAAYPDGCNPSALWFSVLNNPPRLGHQDSKPFLWVLSKPKAIKSVPVRGFGGGSRAFGDYCDVRAEVTHETALL
jgi:hypothetical protein